MSYSSFRSNYEPTAMPGLEIYRPSYPHGEICVVAGKKPVELRSLAEQLNMHLFRPERNQNLCELFGGF